MESQLVADKLSVEGTDNKTVTPCASVKVRQLSYAAFAQLEEIGTLLR